MYTVPYYYYHPYFVKYAQDAAKAQEPGFWSTVWEKVGPAWEATRPYLGAAGLGAGLGGLGAFGASYLSDQDWKKALKSALLGVITGAIASPVLYGGYRGVRYLMTPSGEVKAAPAPPAAA